MERSIDGMGERQMAPEASQNPDPARRQQRGDDRGKPRRLWPKTHSRELPVSCPRSYDIEESRWFDVGPAFENPTKCDLPKQRGDQGSTK
jgi:hypothetical protein